MNKIFLLFALILLAGIVFADSITLLPNANGDTMQFTSNNVYPSDINTNDAATTYRGASTNGYIDLYNITDVNGQIANSTISSIVVNIYNSYAGPEGSADFNIGVKTNGSTYWSGRKTTSSSMATFNLASETWATNPNTSSAWTWSDINSLQVGQRLMKQLSGAFYITYVYVTVNYTPSVESTNPDVNITKPIGGYETSGNWDFNITVRQAENSQTMNAYVYCSDTNGVKQKYIGTFPLNATNCNDNDFSDYTNCYKAFSTSKCSPDGNYFLGVDVNTSNGKTGSDWSAPYKTFFDNNIPIVSTNGTYGIWGVAQTITISCTDTSGSGCGTIYYKKDVDGDMNEAYPGGWTTYTEPIAFNEDGNWGFAYYAVDNAGNESNISYHNFVLVYASLNQTYPRKEIYGDVNVIGNLTVGMPFTLYYNKMVQYSDERIKTNIKRLTESQEKKDLEEVLDMNIYRYKYFANFNEDRVGLLAQEAPVECASYDLFTKLWAVDTTCILYKFLSAFQFSEKQNDSRLSALERQVSENSRLISEQSTSISRLAEQLTNLRAMRQSLTERISALEEKGKK
jgi:hypothetical protein